MLLRFTLLLTAFSLLAACSGAAVKDSLNIQQAALEQAKSVAADQDPAEVINSTRDLQVEAQKEDLYFFSPSYMEQAEDAMSDAESALKDKKPNHEVIAHALTAQKYFKRGLEIKQTAQEQLKLGFDALAMLREIKTDSLLSSDYNDLMDDMKDLIILLEQGKTTEALNDQKGFLADVTELEIKTLKKTHLDPVENAFEKAEDADAEDFAPKSLERAEKAMTALESLIEKSPKQRDQISQDALSANRLAQHAMHVAKTVEPLLKLKVESAEAHVLFVEGLMQRIGKALQQEDVTHLPLDSQSIAIAQSAETIYRQAQAVGQKEQWDQEKQQLLNEITTLKAAQQTTSSTEVIAPKSEALQSGTDQQNSKSKVVEPESEEGIQEQTTPNTASEVEEPTDKDPTATNPVTSVAAEAKVEAGNPEADSTEKENTPEAEEVAESPDSDATQVSTPEVEPETP